MTWKRVSLTGWGRSSHASCLAARPERWRDAACAIHDPGEGGFLAYGGGRSYGDCALNDGGRAILTVRLNRILAFDELSGEVVAEPGVTFQDLLEVFLPKGFLAPVSPGTAYVTVGGAVANDIHGKNHEAAGSFGDHVRWIDLLLASGEIVRTSQEERPELLRATIGGIGLTGVILAVCFGLIRVPSNAVLVTERRISDLDAFLAAFESRSANAYYSVGWIDGLAVGGRLGRGKLITGQAADENVPMRTRHTLGVPCDMPEFTLNRWTIGAFNELQFRSGAPAPGRQTIVPYDRFLYPLDGVRAWNRIYGRHGFRQFQCLVPFADGPVALRRLLEAIAGAKAASFLAVIKAMGPSGPGYLSFGSAGYTLALDFPRRPETDALLGRLERITRDHGGRIYLAKDSCLSAEGFAAMYPGLEPFRAVLATVDPQGRMQSDMARRLRIREPRK